MPLLLPFTPITTFDAAAILLAVTNVLSLFLALWGGLFVLWGAAKAARRMFWTEFQPWKGPQTHRLEEVRMGFTHRLLLGLQFILAGEVLRLLTGLNMEDVVRVGALVLVWVALGLYVGRQDFLREVRGRAGSSLASHSVPVRARRGKV